MLNESKLNRNYHELLTEKVLNKREIRILKKKPVTETLLCEKPSKLLHLELRQHKIDTITNTDVLCIKKNLHRARSLILPNLPKTRNDVHNVLNRIEVLYVNGTQVYEPLFNFLWEANLMQLRTI